MNKIPLLVIVGPTASGKTALSIELAKFYNGEIISADSMQIYKGMNIATAKPTKEEMQGIPHHLISVVEQNCTYSVADYVREAKKIIIDVHSRGKLPVLVGGTGLYVNSLVDNIVFDDTSSDKKIRERLKIEACEKGNLYLLEKLRKVDPESAEPLHENNLTRIIRALEYFEITGEKLSVQNERSREQESPFNACFIGLNYTDRQMLYNRINKRVEIMLHNGLLEEVREVFENSDLATACQAIGYKELLPYFKGEATLDECVELLKQSSRRYAKRQLTWFRANPRINWIMINSEKPSVSQIIKNAQSIIELSGILCYNDYS